MLIFFQRALCSAVLFLAFLLSACSGDNGEGEQTPLLVCDNYQVILANGKCGIPPQLSCTLPEIAVGGVCIVPDDPEPIYKPEAGEAVIYYNRRDKNFGGWVAHLWDACSSASRGSWDGEDLTDTFTYSGAGTTWPTGPAPNHQAFAGEDPIYGAYWVLNLQDNPDCGNFIIHNLDGSVQSADLSISFSADPANPYANMVWVLADNAAAELDLRQAQFSASPICINDVCQAFEPPPLLIENEAAHWLDQHTIVWNRDLSNVVLYGSADAELSVAADGKITGADVSYSLTPTALSEAQILAAPQFSDLSAYSTDIGLNQAKELFRQQLYLVGEDTAGQLYGTQVQLARVLDAVYTSGENDADEAALGPVYQDDGGVTVALWAPTAQQVSLRIFEPATNGALVRSADVAMTRDATTGIWRATGSDWDRKYYRFRVSVFNSQTGQMQTLEVQDPYSVSTFVNSSHSQFVNLNDGDLQPEGWSNHPVPTVANPEAAVIYEGHVRDFSVRDSSTPELLRGKYLAFSEADTAPVKHLQTLKDAGLTHFHMLPSFDFASVDEIPFQQINLDSTVFELCEAVRPTVPDVCDGRERNTTTLAAVLASYRNDDDEARKLVAVMAQLDGFNWGYDPVFYNVPEGSYATDPRGVTRIIEMRAMIKALHDIGLRVVMDVVYNHTSDRGVESAKAIFDKIVPGYYYRRDALTGAVENDSCCNDTASENKMMAKLVRDSLLLWAQHYAVDGFRFDVMSLMPKTLITDSLTAVQAIDPDTYFYGEGWDTSQSTAGDALFERANQPNMAGTGIGTFNDRMRDQMRFLNLVNGADVNRLRTGLAGNLAEFQLVTRSGTTIKASADGGYTRDPQESINYVEKHDNETLWDWLHQAGSLPQDTSLDDRVRIHNLTQSLVLLSQGVPFVQMGSELLRSKSMDGNSYNSGDWFNYLDFTGQTNNWAVGLPPADGNRASDTEIIDAFRDPEALPQPNNIATAAQVFSEFLHIAAANPLFSLRTEQEVIDRVGFHNMGTAEVPGLIVMSIDDGVGQVTGTEDPRPDLDPNNDAVVVVFNGSAEAITHTVPTATNFTLHATLQASVDAIVRAASFTEPTAEELGGSFTVPGYTAAVFVRAQGAQQGVGLSAFASSGYEPPVPYGETAIYLRGEINDWGITDPLIYSGGGSYRAYVQIAAGTYAFKIASEDWSTVDLTTADDTAVAVTLGEVKTLGPGTDMPNLSLTIAADGEYLFSLDALDTAAPLLTVTDAATLQAQTYVRGTLNDWGIAHPLAYLGRSVYQATVTNLQAIEYEFKLASEDWATVDLTTGNADEVAVTAGQAKLLGPGADMPNMTFTPAAIGDYLFTLDAANLAAPMLTVVNADPFGTTAVYLRGEMNDWGTDNQLVFVGAATYAAEITLAVGNYPFKVASEDWAAVNLGADDTAAVALGIPAHMLQDSQTNFTLDITTDGTYRVSVDASGAQALLRIIAVE